MLFLSLFVIILLPLKTLAASIVIFNELSWMGTTTSANDEWIELYNNTNLDIDITNWKIVSDDNAPNIVLKGIIGYNGFYLLERTNNETVPNITANQIYTGALGNNGESLKLVNKENLLIDSIEAASGWPAGNNSTKQTMMLTDEKSWATSKEVNGTPKSKNNDYILEKTIPVNNLLEKAKKIPLTASAASATNAFQRDIKKIEKDNFSFLKIFGLAILISTLSGIAILMLKRLLDK